MPRPKFRDDEGVDKMLPQNNISDMTPNGATLVEGGATFRVFAPNAVAVYLNGTFNGRVYDQGDAATLMEKRGNYWTGFMAGVVDGDRYRFWVEGPIGGTIGYKRDPYSKELLNTGGADNFPRCFSVIRASDIIHGMMPALVRPTSRTW